MKRLPVSLFALLGLSLLSAGASGDVLFGNGAATLASAQSPGASVAGGLLGDTLLDNGSNAAGRGRTVSGVNVAGGWEVYQSFVTDAPGWHVTSVGIDGWLLGDPAGRGLTGSIYPDDGTGQPDRSNPLTPGVVYHLNTGSTTVHWVNQPFNVTLAGNTQYFFGSTPNSPDYWGSIFYGFTGAGSFSYDLTGSQWSSSSATALRIQGTVLPEPGSAALLATGLIGLVRMRRR